MIEFKKSLPKIDMGSQSGKELCSANYKRRTIKILTLKNYT
jgi:hypothetical protein